jgi:hypothetical protein
VSLKYFRPGRPNLFIYSTPVSIFVANHSCELGTPEKQLPEVHARRMIKLQAGKEGLARCAGPWQPEFVGTCVWRHGGVTSTRNYFLCPNLKSSNYLL